MEDLLARERAAEEHVRGLLRSDALDLVELPAIFKEYRLLCQEAILADFQNVEVRGARLWDVHQEGRKVLHKHLKRLRKEPKRVVETRQLVQIYKKFLADGEKYYRQYISRLNLTCGGIPELANVAAAEQTGEGESQQPQLPIQLRRSALESCHQTLIYLGDLSRYRATEKLDDKPAFGPAKGYYQLASTLKPTSGLGYHQEAVVALEERSHLRVMHLLIRAMCVPEPHALASRNLELEIGKVNTAWANNEFIQKNGPGGDDGPQLALEGWLVRLHALCYKGDAFRGYEELEREVLNHLSNCVKQDRLSDSMLLRIVVANIGAQYLAGERFQTFQNDASQQSFMHYFRFNAKTFATLLRLFSENLRATILRLEDPNVEPAALLTTTVRRLLPGLRIYSNWLLANLRMVLGLSGDPFAADSLLHFWSSYAEALDLINQAFSVWDLDSGASVEYLLAEDAGTLQFLPVMDESTASTWFIGSPRIQKPHWTDHKVVRRDADEEMLHRVGDVLNKGSTLAFHEATTPIHLRGTRIYFGNEENIEPPVLRPVELLRTGKPQQSRAVQQKPKPVSYATAAANGHARQALPQPAMRTASSKGQSRDDQLSRMVDDLLDEDDGNNPITPPQQRVSNPAVVTNGQTYGLQDSIPDLGKGQKQARSTAPRAKPVGTRPDAGGPPAARPVPGQSQVGGQQGRMQSVSKLWDDNSRFSSPFPSGLPTGTLASPARPAHGHSRVNSASSIRSKTSQNVMDSRVSADFAPRTLPDSIVPGTTYGSYPSLDQQGMTSPLLFGAGDSVWSPGVSNGFRNASPPQGRGG